jgi:alpha-ketoglutarate-dependent taurine dioxygenase
MEISRLTGRLGAVVDGVNLESIDDETFDTVHDALMSHQVLFFRKQSLSDDGHRALAARFGRPTVYP